MITDNRLIPLSNRDGHLVSLPFSYIGIGIDEFESMANEDRSIFIRKLIRNSKIEKILK